MFLLALALFNHSTVMKEELDTDQVGRKAPVLNVIQSVPTRWNSAYTIERMLEIWPSVKVVLYA